MEKRDTLSKILAATGTALVWIPLLAPVLSSAIRWIQSGKFRFDYLMPAELFPLILAGGVLLLWGAWRAKSRVRLIGGSFAAAVCLLAGSQALAVATGIASGATEPAGWPWALVIAALAGFLAAVAALAVGGVLLVRVVFAKPIQPAGG